MRILAFAASHRRESINRRLAALAATHANAAGADIDFAEYETFDAPLYDDELFTAGEKFPAPVADFISRVKAAKAILLASPEYNWSFPGSLKNLIDWASVENPNPFAGKALLLMSASPSLRGGAQGLVQLSLPFSALGAFVYPKFIALARARDIWSNEGDVNDEKLRNEIRNTVASFVDFAKALN